MGRALSVAKRVDFQHLCCVPVLENKYFDKFHGAENDDDYKAYVCLVKLGDFVHL